MGGWKKIANADGGTFYRNFRRKSGCRSKSFRAAPMKNDEDEIIGVLQLTNVKALPTQAGRMSAELLDMIRQIGSGVDVESSLFEILVRKKILLNYAEQLLGVDQVVESYASIIPGHALW